jgi:DnaJ family protein A protein 2
MNGNTEQTDLYEILNVDKGASKAEIKKAFHKAALANHPDKVAEVDRESAETKFKAVSQAYEILYDDEKRHLYDTHGISAFDGSRGPGGMGAGPDLDDILNMFGMGGGMPGMGGMGGGFGGPGGQRRPRRSPNEEQKYEVSLEDLYKGKTVKFASTKNVICSKCKGSGGKEDAKPKECATCKGQGFRQVLRQVGPMLTQETQECSACGGAGSVYNPKDKCKKCKGKKTTEEKKQLEIYIPRGAREGDKIVLEGEADQIPGTSEPGDIIFHLAELPHDVFQRAGADLSAKLDITLAEALLGFNRVVLEHLDGRGIQLHHPKEEGKILRPGQVLKVKGEGMPYKKSDAKGDLYLIVDIEFPEDGFLSDPQAAEELQKILPGPPPPIMTEEVDEVQFDDEADIEEFGHGEGGGEWVDEDEEGQAQCATQ